MKTVEETEVTADKSREVKSLLKITKSTKTEEEIVEG